MLQENRVFLLISRDFPKPVQLLEILVTVPCAKLVVKACRPQVTNRGAHLIPFPVEQMLDLPNV